MYFKKLEILGFKSFADKTVIEFQPGVTAIVGPNGCGKSNVSDSIRWVLGEQSAKSLRGSSMEDVIFGGSIDKEPLNLSEVSLTLSNETKFLAIDYDEVTITRRLYRSGESEYLLNKNVVRLKDIHELLLGTGIGTDNYSVIEQGKMDRVLNSKPEERRVIFEEAAGITKFKSKKKEALRKLEQTDANLLRVNDIIQEVKRQIAAVERQAKKAEQYKVEFERMKQLELSLASREFLTFEQNRKAKEDELCQLKEEEAAAHEVVSSIDTRYQESRSQLNELEEQLKLLSQDEMASQSEIRRTQDRILMNRERMGELVERRGQLLSQNEAIQSRLTELESEIQNLSRVYDEAVEQEAQGEGSLSTAQTSMDEAESVCAAAYEEENRIKSLMSEVTKRRSQWHADMARIRAEIQSAASRQKRLAQEQEQHLQEIQKIDERLRLPLFEDAAGAGSNHSKIQEKILGFKSKVMDFVRRLFQSGNLSDTSFESEIENEIRQFTDEIGSIQAKMDGRDIEVRHLSEKRQDAEKRMRLLNEEEAQVIEEEKNLKEQELSCGSEDQAIAVEEARFESMLAEAQQVTAEALKAKDQVLVQVVEVRERQKSISDRRAQAEKDKNWITETQRQQQSQLESQAKEAEDCISRKDALEAENITLEDDVQRHQSNRDDILRKVENLRSERDEAYAGLSVLDRERQEKQAFLDEARDRVHKFEMESAELRFEMDKLKERIFNAYQVDLMIQSIQAETEAAATEALMGDAGTFNTEEAKAEIQKIKDKLNRMGPVNLVAIEEHQEMTERFNFLVQQQDDLLKAKDDLHKAIQKINRTTKELFAETFAKAQEYFAEYFKILFNGGQAELVLLDEQDILESGIDIIAKPPGKKLQNITLLSGGEKALTAIALVFALFKIKPSPFCILDEIDAPLDESNVDRFCNVLKDFITTSQFILITHNKRTMNLADAIYGITMAQTGCSRVVSVKFSGKGSKSQSSAAEVIA